MQREVQAGGLRCSEDMNHFPDVTSRITHSEKQKLVKLPQPQGKILPLMEINATGAEKTGLSEGNEVRNVLGRYDISHTC